MTELRTAPEVSVVVPYYRRQDQLDRLLAALDAQTFDPGTFEVVVADDGSPTAPLLGAHAYPARTVRQDDDGFRAAAARNLGANATTGEVVVFLDQDCVPDPTYLERVRVAVDSPWSLVVGHRRHADLDGWSANAVRAWLTEGGPAPPTLAEPDWLLEGYARTRDLTAPDPRAYQLVISAVMSLHRDLFDRLAGFDESFRAYGGEDWEIAHRALVAGADLRWLPDAVAWHDGYDLAGRADDLVHIKNAETLALAARLPDRDVRGEHLMWARPDVVVRLHVGPVSLAGVVAAIESLLAGTDAHVWLDDDVMAAAVAAVVEDPRVHAGMPSGEVLSTARYLVRSDPVVLRGTSLRSLCADAPVASDRFRLTLLRDENRSARGLSAPADGPLPAGAEVIPLTDPPLLERLWRDRGAAAR